MMRQKLSEISHSEKTASRFLRFFSILATLAWIASLPFTWERIHSLRTVIVYVIVPLLGTALCFASLFLPNRLKVRVANFIFAAFLSAFVTEAILTFFWMGDRHLNQVRQKTWGQKDNRTVFEVLDSYRKKGINASVTSAPTFAEKGYHFTLDGKEIFPLSGLKNQFTVLCNGGGYWSTYQSDRFGFNNPDSVYENAHLDVAIVGDSFLEGACVNQGSDIGSMVREVFPKTVTFGKINTGPLMHLGMIKEYAALKKPQVVIWLYSEHTDHFDVRTENQNSILKNYLKAGFSQHLASRSNEIDPLLRTFVKNLESRERTLKAPGATLKDNLFFRILKLTTTRVFFGMTYKKLQYSEERKDIEFQPVLLDVFKEADKTVKSWGGKLIVAYLPNYFRFYNKETSLNYHRDEVLSGLKALNIPIIDLESEIRSRSKEPLDLYPFRSPPHFNEKGYRLTAEILIDSLKKEIK